MGHADTRVGLMDSWEIERVYTVRRVVLGKVA
jgi:hypothetical protein